MWKYLKPKWLENYITIYRDSGLRGLYKKGGKTLIIGLFLFFFIKGTTLYIIIPYLAYKGIISFW